MSTWDELWIEVSRADAQAIGARLLAAGSVGLQEEDIEGPPLRQVWDTGPVPAPSTWVRLRAWFERPGGPARAQVDSSLADVKARAQGWREEPGRDWEAEARASFQPIHAGPFVVAPPWNAPPGSLLITPGSGFGTGDHPTTHAMLVALGEVFAQIPTAERGGLEALDVGCGSGVLAIAAASLGLSARGVDVERAALSEARENALLNSAHLGGSALEFSATPLADCAPADLVLANLHAELLVRLAPDLRRVTRRWLLLAGIMEEKEPLVRAAFAPWEPVHRAQSGRWIALRFEPSRLDSSRNEARSDEGKR